MRVDSSVALNHANYDAVAQKAKTQADTDKLLREQTDAFEAFFLKQVLDIAINSENQSELFPKDAGDKIYKSMYNDTMSQALSGGLGISELLFNYIKEGR